MGGKTGTVYPTVCEKCKLYEDVTGLKSQGKLGMKTHGQDDKSAVSFRSV